MMICVLRSETMEVALPPLCICAHRVSVHESLVIYVLMNLTKAVVGLKWVEVYQLCAYLHRANLRVVAAI
jgi:hypothetical protein